MRVKLFADGADLKSILALYKNPAIKGFTTNPTLMRKAGIEDYEAFARQVLEAVPDRPVSLEVIADDFKDMKRQALKISSWAKNAVVKIPITNTKRESAAPLLTELAKEGVNLNVTAILTREQVQDVFDAIKSKVSVFVSVFAGRIADTGVDPVPFMRECLVMLKSKPNLELLWASPREILNVFQAEEIGCHIITATPSILEKLSLAGKDLGDYSLDTVKMFYDDATKAGYVIRT